MKEYDYKKCKSLFGYSAEVHKRSKGKCQLCGCGGQNFDLWRQMTVEHLIGKSQMGYLKDIKKLVLHYFPNLTETESSELSIKLDVLNTVTACQFCNATTSRDSNHVSMEDLFKTSNSIETLIDNVQKECSEILELKRKNVTFKLKSVKAAYEEHIEKDFIPTK